MIRVYITDDHPSIIHGVEHMLHGNTEIVFAGSFNCGKHLLEGLKQQLPDVLLLDVHLPDITGNRLARIISETYPQVGILAFTNMNTEFHVADMLSHGCRGYLLKTAGKEALIQAIKDVYDDRAIPHAGIRNSLTQAKKRLNALPSLTKREKEILQYICAGQTNQQIADILFLSLRTIENHRFNLQQKLKVKNTAELVKIALQMGMT